MGFKDINFSIAMYGTDAISQPSYPVVYTGDESSVKLNFTVTDEDSLAGATAKVHLYFADSTHIEKPMEINVLVLSYTLVGTQNDHAGIVRADVFITLDGKTYTKAGYKFRIDSSLEANPNIVEYSVETVDKVVTETESWLLQAQTDFGVAQNQRAAEWVVDNDIRDDQFDAGQADRTTSFNASEAGRTAAFNTNETGRSNTFTVNENARQAAADANEGTRDGNYAAAEVIRYNQYEVAEANRDAISGIDHLQAVSDHQTAGTDHTTAISDHNTSVADHSTFDASQAQRTADFNAAQTVRADTFAASEAGRTTAFNAAEEARATGYDADHSRAGTDHTTAVNDHTLAGTDHTTAVNNHTLAGTDHTRAEADHTRADADSKTVAGFNARIVAEETATAANMVSAVKGKTFADVDARFEDIEFDTVLNGMNLIVNGDFSNGSTGWSNVDSVVSGRGSKTATSQFAGMSQMLNTIIGDLYYVAAEIEGTASANYLKFGVGTDKWPNSNVKQRLSYVTKAATNQIEFRIGDNRASGWTVYFIDNAFVINLTATFGAGNEPTAEQMDAILSKFTNSWFNGTKNLIRANATLNKLMAVDARTEFDAKNLVTNGDFEIDSNGDGMADRMTKGSSGSGSLSAVSKMGTKSQQLTDTTGATALDVYPQMSETPTIGNKYYYSLWAKPSAIKGALVIYVGDNSGSYAETKTITSTDWVRYSAIKPCLMSFNLIRWSNSPGTLTIGDSILYDGLLIIDLTKAFGAGKEPTLAEMDRLMVRYPNSWFDGVKPIQTIENLYNEKAGKTQEAWITPTLIGGGTGTIKYRKNDMGNVEFKGTLTGVAGNSLLLMPSGYRPVDTFRGISSNSDGLASVLFQIGYTGQLYITFPYTQQTMDMTGLSYPTN